MDRGFFHPERGYWQATGDDSDAMQAAVDAYPAGTVEVPLRPSPDHQWDGAAWVYVAPIPPTAAEIEAEVQELADAMTQGNERDRALALTLADMWAAVQGVPVADARQAVRDRVVYHLRALRGL